MQIERKPAEFVPVVLVITLDSEAEFAALLQISGWNVTVADAVTRRANRNLHDTIKDVLGKIHGAIS